MGLLSKLFGGSKSVSAPSSVYGAQEPYLQDVWSRALGASQGGAGTQFAQQIGQGAQGGFGQMMQGGFQDPYLQQGLQGFGQMQDQALGGAIESGLGQISRNFQRNIMPSINMGAALTGTACGS